MSITTQAKLLDLADGLQPKIDAKRAPLTQNWTPRRQAQKDAQNRDADNMEKVQRALRALAKAWATDSVPEVLKPIKTKAAVELVLGLVWGTSEEMDQKWARIGVGDQSEREITREMLIDLMGGVDDIAAARAAREQRAQQDGALRSAKRAGFFPTPDALADQVIALAQIEPHHTTLEPSSGLGDLAKRVPGPVVCVEIARDLADRTKEACPDAAVFCDDFEQVQLLAMVPFDRVVMNPPFEKGAAIRHVRHAFGMLADDGRLVAIMPANQASIDLCEELGGTWYDQGSAFEGAAAFKSTSVRVGIAVIDK